MGGRTDLLGVRMSDEDISCLPRIVNHDKVILQSAELTVAGMGVVGDCGTHAAGSCITAHGATKLGAACTGNQGTYMSRKSKLRGTLTCKKTDRTFRNF